MTSFTRTWDASYEATPSDTDDASGGAARIRNLKEDIQERFVVDHHHAGDTDDGAHKKITLKSPISNPSNVANTGFLYLKDVSAKVELHWEDEDGNVLVLTDGGVLKVGTNAIDGTMIAIGSDAIGDIMYYNGTDWVILVAGTDGFHLRAKGAAAPVWEATPSQVSQANQAALEAETDQDTYVPPDLIKHSPGVAKMWAHVVRATGSPVLSSESYNTTSVTDDGAGNTIVTIGTDFSSAIYAVGASAYGNGGGFFGEPDTIAAGAFDIQMRDHAGGTADTVDFTCWAFGEQV